MEQTDNHMRDILVRLGHVLWWLSLCLCVALIAFALLIFKEDVAHEIFPFIAILLCGAVIVAIGRALKYILAGE